MKFTFLNYLFFISLIGIFSCSKYTIINESQYKKHKAIEVADMPIFTKPYHNGFLIIHHYEDENNIPNAYLCKITDKELKTLDSFLIPKPEDVSIEGFVLKNDKILILSLPNNKEGILKKLIGPPSIGLGSKYAEEKEKMAEMLEKKTIYGTESFELLNENDLEIAKFHGTQFDLKTKEVIKSDYIYSDNLEIRENIHGGINPLIRFSPDSTKFLLGIQTRDLDDTVLFIGKTYDNELNKTSEFEYKIFYPNEDGNHPIDITIDNFSNSYFVSAFHGEDNKDNWIQIDAVKQNGSKLERKIYLKNEIREKDEETFIDPIGIVKIRPDNSLLIAVAHNIKRNKTIGFSLIETDIINDTKNNVKSNIFDEKKIEQLVDDDIFFNYSLGDLYFTPTDNIIMYIYEYFKNYTSNKPTHLGSTVNPNDPNYDVAKFWESTPLRIKTEEIMAKNLVFCYDKDFNPKWQTVINSEQILMQFNRRSDAQDKFISHKNEFFERHYTPGYKYMGLIADWRYNAYPNFYFINNNIYVYGLMRYVDRGFNRIIINEKDGQITEKKCLINTYFNIYLDLNNNFILFDPDSFLTYCLDGFYFDLRK